MTENEKIEIQREAWLRGAGWSQHHGNCRCLDWRHATDEAAKVFPLPRVPRVVKACGGWWKWVGDKYEHTWSETGPFVAIDFPPSEYERIVRLAINPYEP